MEHRTIERADGAFQRPLSGADVAAVCRRAFGAGTEVTAAVELGGGLYNTTYRVELRGADPVILRVAPEPHRQYRLERHLMRNEYASVPYLAPIAELLPRTLAADFTHQVIGRDYLIQSHLPGVPAAQGLADYPPPRRGAFWRQLGAILARVHAVRGPAFGRVADPGHATWGSAVAGMLTDIAADLEAAGLDAADVRAAAAAAAAHRAALDEVAEPRLLHGDLSPVNVMIAPYSPDAPEPTIVGVFDCDRTTWGDPFADWTFFLLARNPKPERDEPFWAGYGPRPPGTRAARLRTLCYRARNVGEVRLEQHRLGGDPAGTYPELAAVVAELRG